VSTARAKTVMSSSPRTLVILLCYNGVALTLACLRSLAQATGRERAPFDVLVVDNASSDQTPARVRAQHPEAHVIETGANLGYAAGNNVGIQHALELGYDYVLLLNNDTEVAPDFLVHLIEAAERERDIAVAGPKIYFANPANLIYSVGGMIDWRNGLTHMLGLNDIDTGQFDTPSQPDFICGCCMLVRISAVRSAGMLDPRFGMYYEETEWCVRLQRAGGRIAYVPGSVIWHKIDPKAQSASPFIAYYMTRNRLLFLRQTGAPVSTWLRAALLQDFRTWLSYTVRPKWRHKAGQRAAMVRGWRDFLSGRLGMQPQ
jgi:GT2 family glycosyltransferase